MQYQPQDYEPELTFVYKTVLAYSKYEDYTVQKLQGKYPKNKIYEGYLIDKKYMDYWRKYTDYDSLKQMVQCTQYPSARASIYKYRKTNRYKGYQPDAQQKVFNKAEDLFESVRAGHNSYVLIDYNFWNLICEESRIKERGAMRFALDYEKLTFYFGEFDYIQISTKDNIIDSTKEMTFSGSDIVREEDKVEEELKKLLLLFAFEQEMKRKICKKTFKDNKFQEYFFISEEWISQYKSFYHYNEICKMIEKNEKLQTMLCNGFDEARKNLPLIVRNINIKDKKGFPENLRDNNTFLVERVEQNISPINKSTSNNKESSNKLSFWRNFQPVNKELKDLFSYSDAHQYAFNDSSFSACLITGGKFIINLSMDEFNPTEFALEVGSININNFCFKDEYLLHYQGSDALSEDLYYIQGDFDKYEKEYLVFGKRLEVDLLSKEGKVYGRGFKIIEH